MPGPVRLHSGLLRGLDLIVCVDPFSVSVHFMPRLPVDLDRFSRRCHESSAFVRDIWLYFDIAIIIAAHLDTFGQTRLYLSCLVIQVDRSDVALGATSVILRCQSQRWTVATPPVQVVHRPVSSASPWWDSSDSSHGVRSEAEEGG